MFLHVQYNAIDESTALLFALGATECFQVKQELLFLWRRVGWVLKHYAMPKRSLANVEDLALVSALSVDTSAEGRQLTQ